MLNPEKRSSPVSGTFRVLCVVTLTALAGVVAVSYGFNFEQTASVTVFSIIIVATLFFWDYHLPIGFVGISVLMMMNLMNLPKLLIESKLDIVLFLIGMMVIVGVLKDLGLFSWIIIRVISIRKLSARMFVCVTCVIAAIMSCMVDEVTAIVLVAALIFQVCDTLNLKPVPFIIMAVMVTNIGSTGTMLGNPVGILIGQNASPPLSFIDFMHWSFPLMVMELVVVLLFMLWLFRREIREMDMGLNERRAMGLSLGPIVEVPHGQGLFILTLLMLLLSLHTSIENWLGLTRNTMLIAIPLFLSGLLLLWRRGHVRKYIENDVEWCSLIFFMMLFVVAGTMDHTGVTNRIADGFVATFGDTPSILIPVVLGISAVGSAFIENIVFVAAFMPVVVKLDQTPLMWALLHGACLGGNITMMGSTANIAAIGMLEKRYWTGVSFFTWLKTGLAVGILSCLVAWGGLAIMEPYMPTREARMEADGGAKAPEAGAARP